MHSRRRVALFLIVLGVGFLVWLLVVRSGEDDDSPSAAGEPRIVSAEQLSEFAADAGHPVYWLGEDGDEDLELTETPTGRVYVRYLKDGAEAGDPRPEFTTVGTYPAQGGVASLRRAVREGDGVKLARADDGAVLLIDPSAPESVHFAYPGSEIQIEVFSPLPGEALRLASRGGVEQVP